jgi:uncharacterized membrane protein YphA (DoxX/SURF4 family)
MAWPLISDVAAAPGAAPLRPRRRLLRTGWPAAHLILRLGLAAIFLWAGFSKAFDAQGSINSVDAYRLLPTAMVRPVAAALPWIEIALGVFLLLGLFVRVAAVGAGLLTVAFLVALGQAKARGLAIDCGCFGAGGPGQGVGWWDLVRDGGLLVAAAVLAWRPGGPLQLDRSITGGGDG